MNTVSTPEFWAAMSTAIATLVTAIGGLIAVILTHGKVGATQTKVDSIKDTVETTATTLTNGGDTHGGTTDPSGPIVRGNG